MFELEALFKRLNEQVLGLQDENQVHIESFFTLPREVSAYQGPLQVLEAFEEPTKAPKIAFEALPGHPPLAISIGFEFVESCGTMAAVHGRPRACRRTRIHRHGHKGPRECGGYRPVTSWPQVSQLGR